MTHPMIKSKALRTAYASELWQIRSLLQVMTEEERWAVRLGIETGIWAAQKIILRDMQ